MGKTTAFIGLGANQGQAVDNLSKALKELAAVPGIELEQVAGLYKTSPVGYLEQDWFYNTVAKIKTSLDPLELLRVLLNIEDKLGRVRTIRWGPRVVDLDLLLFGNQEINLPNLQVPHPRMLERSFVLVPLAELAPELKVKGKIVGKMAQLSRPEQEIIGVGEKVW